MENIPPPALSSSAMTVDDETRSLPTLDQLVTRSKPGRKSRRPVTRILSPRPNEDRESAASPDFESGLFSPPPSQKVHAMDPSSTLISPPPEETIHKQGRTPIPAHVDLPSSASKRKRQTNSPYVSSSSSTNADREVSGDSMKSTVPAPATPNPKPRKQSKRTTPSHNPEFPIKHSFAVSVEVSPPTASGTHRSTTPSTRSLLLSPHAANPNADFIPPLPTHTRNLLAVHNRRSITPIPPYEPPRDTFVPPREVIGTPTAKANKRKPPMKRSGKQLKLVIKEELPDLDLSLPLPPASPTEDPLLLAGLPREKDGPNLASKRSTVTPPILSNSSEWDGGEMLTAINLVAGDTSDSSLPYDLQPRADDIVFPIGEWSDSDDDVAEFNQTGEFTGKFTTIRIPTKADPPTSVTKERQDAWGRPVSPFPYPNRRKSRWSSPLEPCSPSRNDADHELPGSDDDNLDDVPIDEVHNVLPSQEDVHTAHNERTLTESTSTFDAAHPSFAHTVSMSEHPPAGETSPTNTPSELISSVVTPMFNFIDVLPERQETKSIHVALERHKSRSADVSLDVPSHNDLPETNAELSGKADDSLSSEEAEQQFVDRELSQGIQDGDPEHVFGQSLEYESSGDDQLPYRPSPSVHQSAGLSHMRRKLEALVVCDESDGSDEDEELDLGVIKISSEDPKAAARAAAILKLHNYDCLPEILRRKRRSQSSIDSVMRGARRKSVSSSGISKGTPRRRTIGGVIGDKLFSPGSPVTTLPELLKEAEVDLEKSVSGSAGLRTPIRTYAFPQTSYFAPESSPNVDSADIKPREWNKNDWKLLDACFTDERLDVGERLGLADNVLADVHDVEVEDIVDRFIQMMGGDSALEILGSSWTREDIWKRTRALEKKQRAGKGAPGTPQRGPTPVSDTSTHIEVPDFTPLGRRHDSSAIRCDESAKLPPTLLAPRYSHLMDEAVSISKGRRTEECEERSQSPGLFKRLTSPIFSYLPSLNRAPPEQRKTTDQHGLPLPPPELFEKERDPIVTPVPKPAPRITHPKDLVHLQPAPPPKVSLIPRVRTKPRRLVDLRHAPLPATPLVKRVPSGRRSSGGSVKDLVKGFERLDESTDSMGMSRSTKSINEWRGEAPGVKTNKPKWRP